MQHRVLPLLMSMVVLSPMAIDIFLASVPVMAVDLNASTSQVQSTISIFFFAMGLGQIFVGPVADRYGRKVVALAGLFVYSSSSLLIALSADIVIMQWLRLFQGLAACAISVVIFSVVRDSFPYHRISKIYSYLNGVLSVIPASAPIVGTLMAAYFGWRSTFVFMALYALLVFVVVLLWLPETLSAENKARKTKQSLYDLKQYLTIVTDGCFMFYALCCMAGMAAILTYVSYAPLWLIAHLDVSMTTFSLLFGLNALVGITAAFVAPVLINKYGNRKVVIIALTLMLGCALVLCILSSGFYLTGMLAAFAFMGPIMLLSAGLSFVLGPATSMALAQFSDRAGTASALLGFIQMVGASIIVLLVQHSSLLAPMAVVVVLAVFVVPLLLVINSKRFADWHCER
ncbi:multidrug effflux MFS transporter [Gammaproteobacteria bacterium AS21]